MVRRETAGKGLSVREARIMLADEHDAVWLYEGLAGLADAERAATLRALADVERRHAEHWRRWLRDREVDAAGEGRPSLRVRGLLAAARLFGLDAVLPVLVRLETRAVTGYDEHAPHLAAEEAEHARTLATLSADAPGPAIALSEPVHRSRQGGALRAGVFGINDGLVSNAALVLGVAGGGAEPAIIVLAGVAGLVAGAASMAAGEWVSVQSQRELQQREIAHEAAELEAFPDEERRELEVIFRAKGLAAAEARSLADRLMEDPEVALDVLAREELGLDPGGLPSPWAASSSSFLAFALGAVLPLLPFLLSDGGSAVAGAVAVTALGLFTVGALVSLLTGRSLWWSGTRMVLVGALAAGVTALVGSVVGAGPG